MIDLAPATTSPLLSRAVAAPQGEVASFPQSGTSIVLRDIARIFDQNGRKVHAVRDFSLTVAAGEFCVIVGPSGCGKTTVLRILAGLETATSGSVTLDSDGPGNPTNAMVFQGRSVFPWRTVRQNISYGLDLRNQKRADRKAVVDQLLDTVGLTRFANAYPHQLSEGMRQRVAIARALAVNPDLLLMDEPFGALDEQTRLIMQEELLRIWENTGKTVVFVTHSIDEALILADHIVVMSPHPGTISEIIPVPFPRPRSMAAVRSDPQFAALFSQIWDLLRGGAIAASRGETEAAP